MPEQAKHILSSYDAALYGLRNDTLMMSSLTDRILQTAFEAFLTPKLRSTKLMTDRRLPACRPELLRARPIASVQDLRGHTLLHSATTSSAWSEWFTLAAAPHLKPVQQNYLLLSEHQEEDAAVRAFRSWIMDTARPTVR
jgi:hypothetical protein